MAEEDFSVDVVLPVSELETLILMAVAFARSPTDDGVERNVEALVGIIERRAVVLDDRHRALIARAIINLGGDVGESWLRALRALQERDSRG